MRKNYILDANILLHDPYSIFHFADNTVIIPIGVISELDQFKKEQTDRGFNARTVVRQLDALRLDRSLTHGVELENGGQLRVYCDSDHLNGNTDSEILRIAKIIRDVEPDTPVVIVTKDINLRIRADALGLRAEDYETDHVELADLYSGHSEHAVTAEQFDEFRGSGATAINNGRLDPNHYVLLRHPDGRTLLGRIDSQARAVALRGSVDDGLWGVKPRNKEQHYAVDALLDERVQLVTLMGQAGTGKTLLALAAAMFLALKRKRYRGIIVGRPIFPLGRDLGFLPGDVSQKLDPWMKPIVDTVEFLLESGGTHKGHANVEALLKTGLVEIQPLTYIRGRSISNRFVVIDEAQNLTPLEVKTVITRIGQDAKIVLTGDPYQIDNPYVDANSNGFTYLINKFRNQEIAAHIELRKGERSVLAELAANLL